MRIVISGIPNATPIVLENLTAVLLAGSDDATDGSAPCLAHGSPQRIAELGALALMSVREKLGEDAFEAVIRAARRERRPDISDVTESVRGAS